MTFRIINVFIILMLAGAGSARAQSSLDAASRTSSDRVRKEMRVHRIPAAQAPDIDGRLDDAFWQTVPFASDFIAKQPVQGAAPSARTEVAFAYDDDALYVGARMFNRNPGEARRVMNRHDSFSQSEVLLVAFDSFLDRRTAYTFAITPAGVRTDFFQPTDGELSRDFGYNPVWEGRAVIQPEMWTTELRIPFSQIRFHDRDVQTWGLNIDRWIPSRNEDIFWVMIPREENGWSSRFGNLVGIEGIRPSRRLELLPYVATAATVFGDPNPANPFAERRSAGVRAGGDLKVGLGPSLTLEATINPDFGQVEADPAEVNLSAVETVFAEKRPFFAEGADLLQIEGFFNSRRIGAPPHLTADGDYISQPDNSTILGAAKLSGRLPGNLSIGALAAVTGQEHAETFTLAGARRERVLVEPYTAYGVLRSVKQFGRESSTLGGILTGTFRDVDARIPLAAAVNRSAVTGAADWNLRFNGGGYQFSGMAGFTHIAGDTASINRVQRSSAHYLQRPDQSEDRYDPTLTSLGGVALLLRLQKHAGRHWLWEVWGEAETPGVEKNDVGRLMGANDIDGHFTVQYREAKPGRTFYSYDVAVGGKQGYNVDWNSQFSQVWTSSKVTFLNQWALNGQVWLNDRADSDAATRGGPLMQLPRSVEAMLSMNTNTRLTKSFKARLDYRDDELGGWTGGISGGIALRPNGSSSLAIDPRYQRLVDARQYVSTVTGGAPRTFGNRYVFANVDRTTISAQIRLNYFASPDLTFEMYAEPFVSSGKYRDFGELFAPRTSDLRVYGTDGTRIARGAERSVDVTDGGHSFSIENPDFNVRSFRSSAVLRWQWRPGSTFFVVWQQRRSAFDPFGDQARTGELWDSFVDTGDHYLVLKASYWLPIR